VCGRYASSKKPDDLAAAFDAEVRTETLTERYNVAPTTTNYVVLERREPVPDADEEQVARQLRALRWGLVPSWAKDVGIGNKMINARAETLLDKSVFKVPLLKRRCLVPADGYYEWFAQPGRKQKQPFFIRRRDGEPLAMAGLYEVWRNATDPDAEPLWSFTIITTDANDDLRHIHDRMPAMVPRERWDEWLDPANGDGERLRDLLRPAPLEDFEAYPVSTQVNNVRNDGPDLLAPIPSDDQLF
jgi:putative SOS response-associated peptidase YedK